MTPKDFAPPVDDRYFEDYVPGLEAVYGPIEVTEDEIIAFARRFDPQPMHTDPERAARGAFGGLIASGWHTGSLLVRLYVQHYLTHVASLASPGIDELRWIKPVRPSDELWLKVRVLEAVPSKSKPDRGLVRTLAEGFDRHGDVVMRLTAMNIVGRRHAGPVVAPAPAAEDVA